MMSIIVISEQTDHRAKQAIALPTQNMHARHTYFRI